MDRINALSTGTKIMAAAGLLLLIDTFLRWQEVCVGAGGFEVCGGESGWGNFWGVLLGLLTLVLLIWIGLQIANVDMSSVNLPVTDAMLTLGLGVLIFVFALLKNLIDDYSTLWSYIGVGLAALVAVGAYLRHQELGGEPVRRSTTPTDTPSSAPPPPA
jgi:hypothetical protein